jgi:hypothetical protein
VGTVGPGYHITLKTKSGKLVKTLRRGTYRFVIHDKATIHAFSMDGPHGFDHDFTKIPFVGTKTSTIKLRAGKYKYYCPNHESIMFAQSSSPTRDALDSGGRAGRTPEPRARDWAWRFLQLSLGGRRELGRRSLDPVSGRSSKPA